VAFRISRGAEPAPERPAVKRGPAAPGRAARVDHPPPTLRRGRRPGGSVFRLQGVSGVAFRRPESRPAAGT